MGVKHVACFYLMLLAKNMPKVFAVLGHTPVASNTQVPQHLVSQKHFWSLGSTQFNNVWDSEKSFFANRPMILQNPATWPLHRETSRVSQSSSSSPYCTFAQRSRKNLPPYCSEALMLPGFRTISLRPTTRPCRWELVVLSCRAIKQGWIHKKKCRMY